jgi:large repetitive protein
MTSSDSENARKGRSRIANWLLAIVLLLGAASAAQAQSTVNCSDAPYFGVIDGNVHPDPPAQITIDGDCTIRNFPDPPNPLESNISFYAPGGGEWLIIFDNVRHTGQMSCNSNEVHEHKIWFTNSSSSNIHQSCRDLFIPVEKIDKASPGPTATVGVPFTYTLTIPVLFDPNGGIVIDDQGSPNDLHGITIWDDLNQTGAVLSYVSHVAYLESSGAPLTPTFSDANGFLTFDNFPVIPAGEQIVIELTVVLEDVPANAIGTVFVNTAKWDFGRLIDGVFHEPLPGEWGVSEPMTIAAPNLIVDKTGPATMNLGETGQFTIDVLNSGLSDAWNVTLIDRLPSGPTGGMCDAAPVISSVTLAGTPLAEGSHYTLAYTAGPPTCEITLTLLDAAGPIGPNEHLIVTYEAELDADTQNGASLTNVAGATEWFNGDSSISDRQPYTRTVTNGTIGTDDHQDAHTVTVAITGYFFEKTVANLTTGASPTATAAAGHTLRYTLRLVSATELFTNVRIYDELDALNASPAFVPGSLNLVAWPAGADISNTSSTGGANGTGVIDIRNLNVPMGGQILIQFDVTLAADLAVGTVVTNQSALRLADNTPRAISDDPNVNGPADPDVAGDEDPTRVVIVPTTLVFEKTVANVTSGANPAAEASPGDRLRYRLRLQNLADFALAGLAVRDEIDRLNTDPAFQPGTLTVVTVPAGADASNTNATGGASGTGVLDVRNLTLAPSGGTTIIEFEVTLASVIANGTDVLNQSQLLALGSAVIALSDDPNINGAADPNVAGDEDPTRIRIVSAAAFQVQKISTDMTGDPAILLAGETLRYTITVRNVGNSDATDVRLRDQIPVNTTYVAGSTTLNGAPVADVGGTSALVAGMLINAPGDSTPGAIPADVPASPDNVVTITFDVVVDPSVIDGTVISNQGFVSAVDAGIVDQPSDDPATPTVNDPTRDIVGNLPLLFAAKDVVLFGDQGTPGVVDPGDVLRYTISVQNSGTIAATGVVLRDAVPANTTYVADSTLLNGLPVGQPDGGASPLAAGIDISSSDLTPPLPGAGAGTISAGASAVLQFDLRVNDGVPTGTLISNQAVVETVEVPNLPTDGDGNPATGPEPTVVVVGAGQQLSITKQVAVVGGGPAVPGAELEYVVTVTNIAAVPALYVVITDDLDASQTGYLTYVDQSATMNGSTAGVSFAGTTITADYAGVNGNLEPGATVVLRFRAVIAAGLAIGTRITNTGVVTWNNPPQTASASVSIDIGGMPGVGVLNGTAWHDTDFDDSLDTAERPLEGWTVDLYRDGELVFSTVTDASGVYRISGLAPNYTTGEVYELRFLAPGAVATTAALGRADSDFTNYMQRITDIVVQPGANLQNLNLPIDPNGVVYNSITRLAVAGAVLTLLDAGTGSALPASCFDDPAHQNQVTLAGGWYKFEINFNDPACPSGGNYLIGVSVPGSGYVAGYSEFIPPISGPATAPFDVPSCPGSANDAIAATAQHCEVQVSEFAPATSVPARSAETNHHVHLMLDGSQLPGSSQLYNNHLPLDPTLDGAVAISKTTPMLNVTRGQLVPYTITVHNQFEVGLPDVTIVDRYPAGFVYVEGSARLDGVAVEPAVAGRELAWAGLTLSASGEHKLLLLLAVGAGVSEGEFVNRAQVVHSLTGNTMSGEATATVRVVPDPTFDCTDVTGKVFDDANRNKVQDDGEGGLAGVRVVTARGLSAITDAHGRYHITCAVTPVEGRGSNFVLKLDDRTLPSGYRPSTESALVLRATRGKALKFNFGASIHRVVGLDIADAVFEPGSTEIRIQWQPRLQILLDELEKAPAVLRLSYLADVEDADLVERRVQAIRRQITESWEAKNSSYQLTIEPEVFWRLGGPPEKSAVREPSGR